MNNPNPDNEWLDQAAQRVAAAMIDWLKNTINTKRPINTMSKEEMAALAGCAIGAYCIEQGRRPETQRPYASIEDLLV